MDKRLPVQSTMDVRAMNKKKVFSFLRNHAQSTRKEVSRDLGLSFGTVATICNELIDDGLIISVSSETSNGGRIPDLMSLKSDSRHVACLDLIQKEQAVLALCNLEGKVSSSLAWDTTGFRDFAPLKNSIASHYRTLLSDAGINQASVLGIGVAIPALLSHENGLVTHSTNPLLEHVSLRSELEEAIGLPAIIENESNLLAAASASFEYETETSEDIIYLYINEGLGAGITCNGRILVGTRGLGGEVNHFPIGKREYRCYCGNDNCVETELSMSGFLRKYREDSGVDLGHNEDSWHRFEKLVMEQDRSALAVCQENAQVLGCLIATLCNLFDPVKVFIGGMLDDVFETMRETTEREFKKRLAVPRQTDCPIMRSPVANGLLLRGCVESVMRHWMPKPMVGTNE